MSTLDKAFINAYKRQGSAAQTAVTPAAPTPTAIDAAADKIESRTSTTSAKLNDLMAALEKPSGKIVDTPAAVDNASDSVMEKYIMEQSNLKSDTNVLEFAAPSPTRAGKSKTTQKRKKKTPPAPTLDELDVPDVVYRLDPPSPTIPDAPRSASFSTPPVREKSANENRTNSIADPSITKNRTTTENSPHSAFYDLNAAASASNAAQRDVNGANSADVQKSRRLDTPEGIAKPANFAVNSVPDAATNGFYPETTIRVFQPMLQVNHFAWPKVCHRIEAAADAELDRLADTMQNIANQGMKVVGVCSGQRGEGATTMLLCAARRLAARGKKIVAVDADLSDPQLAKRLGLLPQLGWEDVAAGRQPVEEVLIESATDHIAILPLCTPLDISGISYAAQRLMAECLNTLRNNYDLVLMDFGPLENPQSISDLSSSGLNCRIDAITIVNKTGKVPASSLPAVRQSLASAGIIVAGVIENFVRDPSPNP